MEQGVCTWWDAGTTLTQPAHTTPSIHKWTTNRRTDRDANTDTLFTQSRTPSLSGQSEVFVQGGLNSREQYHQKNKKQKLKSILL